MRISLKQLAVASSTVLGVLVLASGSAAAATFNQNHIIDDYIFNNYTTMNANQINGFLNSFPSSCISPNNGFASSDVTGYSPSTGFTYGSNVSAGTVIAHVAQAYGINPQVILSTLQKEQSLVSGGGGCSTLAYTAAVGYGCPDNVQSYNYSGLNLYNLHGSEVTSVSGTCVNAASKAGFSQQIVHGAWLMEFGQHRSEGQIGWNVQLTTTKDWSGNTWNSTWDNSDDPQSCYSGPMTQGTFQTCPSGPIVSYDGYTTIDGTSVHMDTGSTAALYWYTPHFNGNQNFFNIFTGWFGPTLTSGFIWQYVSQNAYTDQTESAQANLANVFPGQRYYLTVQAKNIGTQTWTQGIVNLGTSQPTNRSSLFYDSTWPTADRAATLDQSSVAPGQTGSFSFWVTIPNNPGLTYKEYFDPVADGYSWMNDMGLYWQFAIQKPYQYSYVSSAAYTDQTMGTAAVMTNMAPGQRYYMSLTVKNTGDVAWSPGVVNLATDSPIDRTSLFHDSTWPSKNRAATVTSIVQPGQNATFNFWVQAPLNQGGTFNEAFNLVADGNGGAWMPDMGLYWQFTVPNPQYSWQYISQNAYTDQTMGTPADLTNVTPGQRYYLTLSIKNTGNVIWYPGYINLGTSDARDRTSLFHDSTWQSNTRAATVSATTAPGQTATFNFWAQAPYHLNQGGIYKEYFDPVADGITWLPDYGQYWQFNMPNPQYSWQYISQNAYTDQTMGTPANLSSLTPGQRVYITLSIKNTGNAMWYPGDLNLGTSQPLNRTSQVYDSTWQSSTRAGSIAAVTASGQTATISFWATAPSKTGTYKEYFDPVADMVTWLPDYGLYWQFTVQ